MVALAGIIMGFLSVLPAQPAEAAAAAPVIDNAHARQQSPTTNYGTTETLIVRNDVQSFIRLDISGVTTADLASVELQLSKKNSANRITIAQAAENAANAPTSWTTSTLTWAGKPPVLSGTSSVTVDAPAGSTAVTVDITTLVVEAKNRDANALTLSLTTAGTAGTDIFSTRTADPALRPAVRVSYGIAEHMLVDDAGVRSTAPTTNYGTTPNLIVGKGGHAYLRLKIGQLKADELSAVTLNLSKYNTAAEIVAVRASEYASSNGAATTTRWTETGVTWNTRPLDIPGSATASVAAAAGNQTLALNLTELVRQAKAEGADTLTVHLTTAKVDDLAIAGTDIHSTRATDQTKAPWVKVARTTDESPVDYPVKQQLPTYPANGRAAQEVVRIKNVDGQYLRADTGTGAITLTAAKDQASRFAIYGYDYTASEYQGTGGGQQTTYAIKDLASGKFLTIQNYADDGDGAYYAKSGSDYVVTATAPEVKWNERFSIKLLAAAGTVTISSPLEGLRDESEAPTTAIKASTDGLRITPGDRNGYRFAFESVEASLLEVQATASGTTAHLSWLPVGGDTDPAHYSLGSGGAAVTIADGVLRVDVPNLTPGTHSFVVRHDNAGKVTTSEVTARIFNHPGVSLTTEQLNTMRDRVAEKAEPWYSDYLRMKNTVPNDLASLDFQVIARAGVGRGNPEGSGNMKDYEYSSTAAYFHALQWAITGDDRHAEKAVEILNAWSSTLKQIDGRDQILGAGLSTLKLINAAEIVRYYDGGYDAYADENFAAFQRMLLDVVYPVIQDAGVPMIANGNWDGAAIVAVEAIGVVTDNTAVFDEAVRMYKSPYINGSIENYVTDWGQATESARDQAHAQLGLGLMADTSVIANNQDVDLWSIDNNKLARAFNWVAEYNLFEGEGTLRAEPVPNVFGRTDANAFWDEMDEQAILRGQLRPIYESALAHYSTVDGVDVTWLRRAAEAMRPQGFVHFDSLNFDTLTMYNGKPTTTPAPYFQLRTMLTPWYQRAWSEVTKWGDVSKASRTLTEGGTIPADYTTETLESYFAVRDDGTVAVESMQATAPYFRLVTNDDESYSIQEVTTGRYLGVSPETVGQDNLITAESHVVGDAQKFQMRSTGLGRSYFVHDGRLVYVGIDGSPDAPRDATLTLRLGTQAEGLSTETTPANALLFSYGTAESDKATVAARDTTLTTADTWNPTSALTSATSTDGTAVTDLSSVVVTGTVDTTVPGTYEVTYHVGTATASVTVTVVEATAPSVQIGDGGGVRDRTAPLKVSGTASPGNTGWGSGGETVRVEVRGTDGAVKTTADTAVSEERWSATIDVASLPAGDYTLTAVVQSRAKGTAEATMPLALRIAGPAQTKPGTPQLSSDNWDADGAYRLTMDMWWGPNAWDVQWLENGVPIRTDVLTDKSPAAQKATLDVTGKANGTYVYTVLLTNQHGTTTSAPLTVAVTAANPGVAELSHDNWDGDGNYIVTTNMWWGTNATEYRLYENGNLVDQKPLAANGKNAQSATTPLTGRTPGTYEYVAVLSNPQGETRSKPVTVTVTR